VVVTDIRVESYLTGKLRSVWPDAIVFRIDGQYILKRVGEPDLGLGDEFHSARLALYAVIRYHKATIALKTEGA